MAVTTLRPPLGLSAALQSPNGTERLWWSGDRYAYNRPQGLTFGTKRGDGFADANLTLPRRIDLDWPDGRLLDSIVLVGEDGSVPYEGRIAGTPRTIDTAAGQSMSFVCGGWMGEAKRRKFAFVYVDRDVSHWSSEMPINERLRIAGSVAAGDWSWVTEAGGLSANPSSTGSALATKKIAEAWYTAPRGTTIARVQYRGKDNGSLPGSYQSARLVNSDADTLAGTTETQAITLDDTLRTAPFTVPQRYIALPVYSNGNAMTPSAGTARHLTKLALGGDHDLDWQASLVSGEPDCLYVSDIIRDIGGRFAPKLSMAGVQDSTYPLSQAAFLDRIFPYDAWTQLNAMHMWGLEVWENRTLHWGPTDMSEPADWQVKTTDYGFSTTLQGDTIENLANGVEVTYTDLLTGRTETLTPDDYAELGDGSVENPANQWGDTIWLSFELGFPCLESDAVQFGIAALAEFNQPRQAGEIHLGPYIKDAAGHWQQGFKPRAGETIAITDFPNNRPRLIVETQWSDETKELTLSVDSTFQRLDAVLDRIVTSVTLLGA